MDDMTQAVEITAEKIRARTAAEDDLDSCMRITMAELESLLVDQLAPPGPMQELTVLIQATGLALVLLPAQSENWQREATTRLELLLEDGQRVLNLAQQRG